MQDSWNIWDVHGGPEATLSHARGVLCASAPLPVQTSERHALGVVGRGKGPVGLGEGPEDNPMKCRKRSLRTKRQAEKAMAQVHVLNMSKGQERKNKWLHVYECPECKAWHVGHINRKHRRNGLAERG